MSGAATYLGVVQENSRIDDHQYPQQPVFSKPCHQYLPVACVGTPSVCSVAGTAFLFSFNAEITMRYLVQFIIPAAIVATVVYLLVRNRTRAAADPDESSDIGTFMLILIVGATVAIASVIATQGYLE
jgi:purine-cytosine permease-like protein